MTTDQKYRKIGRPSREKQENVSASCSWQKSEEDISISANFWGCDKSGESLVFRVNMKPVEAEKLAASLLELCQEERSLK